MASPNLSEIVTTTLRNRSKQIADNVSNGNALLAMLNRRGNVKPADGGRTMVQELDYAENSTFMYYSGYEQLDVSPSDVISAAEFTWKQAAVNVSWSGLEADVQNAGEEQILDLVEARITNAERTMRNNISTGIYSDGTGTSGKQIGGLQHLVADAPATGTVGGINRANFSFWRNQVYDFSSASANASAATIQTAMRKAWIVSQRGPDTVDMWVAGSNYYEYFWDSLTTIQRITEVDTGEAGFDALKFRSSTVMYDGDSGLNTNRMYGLNTDYLFWRPHRNRNMVPLDRKTSINQDATVVPLIFAGNLTMSNAARQVVIHA